MYPPGSVFKMVVAAAGLQEGTLTPSDRVHCTGEFHLGTHTFRDWKKEGHGSVDLMKGIRDSCDVYFYTAGLKVGRPAMAKSANAFGFGAITGIDFGSEKPGRIPQPRISKRGTPTSGHAGETATMATAPGPIMVT